jgi:CRP-like cAMP-binding protein
MSACDLNISTNHPSVKRGTACHNRRVLYLPAGIHQVMVVAQERMDSTSILSDIRLHWDYRTEGGFVYEHSLETLPLFHGLTPSELKLVISRFEDISFPAEHVVFNQGDPADKLYVVISGRVAIRFKPDDGDILNVTEVERNGVFGWSAVLGRQSYTSSAICLEDCEAVYVRGDVLRKLCETHAETGVIILERLAEVIAERLRSTHAHVVDLLQRGIQPPSKT